MSPKRARMLLVAAVGATGVLAGCHKDAATDSTSAGTPTIMGGPPMAAGKAFDAESEPHAAGKKVLVASGCFRCHAVDGARPAGGMPGMGGPGGMPKGGPGGPGGKGGPGRGGMGAPDLGKVGQDPEHTADWLSRYILNPKDVKPDSKMPAFQGKMAEDDLKNLVEYLASLK